MGLRGELFSTRLSCDGRTYFFNVKENRSGDLYLTVVESKPTESGDFDRRSIVIFQDNMDEFLKAFGKSKMAMDEAAPSIRSKPPRTRREAMEARDDGRADSFRLSHDEMPRHFININSGRRADSARPERSQASKDRQRSPEAAKSGRVIRVKKKTNIAPPVKEAGSYKKPGPKKPRIKRDK